MGYPEGTVQQHGGFKERHRFMHLVYPQVGCVRDGKGQNGMSWNGIV